MKTLYDNDFYAWTLEQSKLLRLGKLELLDIENLAEEIECLGKRERQELRNRLGILVGHLLKWQYQPEYRSKSWMLTIREQRRRVTELLQDNPSLKPYLTEALQRGFLDGIDLAVKETGLNDEDLPQTCPYTIDQILNPNFLPES